MSIEFWNGEELEVLRYCGQTHPDYPRTHLCMDKDGNKKHVDLMVSGSFDNDLDPEFLVGKKISVSYCHAFIAIADHVEII